MSEVSKTEKDKKTKKSWFDGVKAEFKKIIWSTKDEVTKQTIAVTATAVMLAVIIAIVDTIIKYGLGFFIS